jgi:hypothetical protein
VVLQIVLEALRLISGPSAPTSYARDSVTRPLVQDLIALEAELRDGRPKRDEQPEWIPLSLVRYLLSHGRRTLQPVPTDPQGAWAALREHRRVIADHDYDNAMFRVLLSIDLIRRGHPPEDLEGIRDDWATCSNFLMLDVLPHLHLLRGPLLSKSIMLELDSDDVGRWERVLKGDGPRSLDEVGIRLGELLSRVQTGGQAATYSVDGLLADLQWWFRLFLRAPEAGTGLHQIIDRCPADLWKVLRSAFEGAEWELGLLPNHEQDELWVFCTERSLMDVFRHIRINTEETREGGAVSSQFRITVSEPDPEHVTVTVRSTGNGSSAVIEDYELELFGGKVTPMVAGPAPWTRHVAVTLQRWRSAA